MRRVVPLLLLAIAGVFLLALGQGDEPVPLTQVLAALSGAEGVSPVASMIVTELRFPRALMAMLVGAALAVGGTITQAVMRNPLAEPALLGINAGAALAAMIILVQVDNAPHSLLPWLAFGGALAMSGAIYALAWREGGSSLSIILIGVGLAALAGAASSFISYFGDIAKVHRALYWLAGSLQDSRWVKVQVLALWLVVPLALVWAAARELDLIALGDEVARGRGQNALLVKGALILACAAISGAAVASAGLIAFVGLAAPHLARRLVGPSHAQLTPVAALVGALMVLSADLAARGIAPPLQLPVGIMTALLGAPFFGYLLWRSRHG